MEHQPDILFEYSHLAPRMESSSRAPSRWVVVTAVLLMHPATLTSVWMNALPRYTLSPPSLTQCGKSKLSSAKENCSSKSGSSQTGISVEKYGHTYSREATAENGSGNSRALGSTPRTSPETQFHPNQGISGLHARAISSSRLNLSPKLEAYTAALSTRSSSGALVHSNRDPHGSQCGLKSQELRIGRLFSGSVSGLDAFSPYHLRLSCPALPARTTGTPEATAPRSSYGAGAQSTPALSY